MCIRDRRLLHDIVKLCLGVDAVGPGTVGDVVIDTHREGIGFLDVYKRQFDCLVDHIHLPLFVTSRSVT